MALVTKQSMALVYDMLKKLSPFNQWSLPPKTKVQFVRSKEKNLYGSYLPIEGKYEHRISICPGVNLPKFIETMAHEMCHMKQALQGNKALDSQQDWHDREFRKLARDVCRQMGFKLKEF